MKTLHIFQIIAVYLALGILTSAAFADQSPYCAKHNNVVAVDLSQPSINASVGSAFLDKLREINIKTVIRYYSYDDDNGRNKTMYREERDLLTKNGFDIAVVFQHHNNCPAKFKVENVGKRDALQALYLANLNAQPAKSAIYFGVDFSPGDNNSSLDDVQKRIKDVIIYFKQINIIFKESGFDIGVYGSGSVCDILIDKLNLAQFCWLSQSSSFSGTKRRVAEHRFDLNQLYPNGLCGNIDVDFNVAAKPNSNFGQFKEYLSVPPGPMLAKQEPGAENSLCH